MIHPNGSSVVKDHEFLYRKASIVSRPESTFYGQKAEAFKQMTMPLS
jgi:hypothetical protein